MKVLLVVTNADLAGAPIHVLEIVKELKMLDVLTEVVFGEEGPIKKSIELKGVRTHLIPTLRSNINLFQDISSFSSLNEVIYRVKPDVVHCHSSKAGLISRLVCSRLNVPVVYTIHGWGFGPGRRRWVSLFVYLTEVFLAKKTSKFISVSEEDRRIGVECLKISPDSIVTIYNGISFKSSHSGFRPKKANLIMVARNDPQKDYPTLFKSLRTASFDKAFLIGRGTDDIDFINKARNLMPDSVFSKIEFLGIRNDIEKLLEKASFFVLATNFEGLPISIIEAMSKSLPIVASNVGGISELVTDHFNGFLINRGDSDSLSRHISLLSNDLSLRHKLGQRSMDRYELLFTSKSMVLNILKVYEEVANL